MKHSLEPARFQGVFHGSNECFMSHLPFFVKKVSHPDDCLDVTMKYTLAFAVDC